MSRAEHLGEERSFGQTFSWARHVAPRAVRPSIGMVFKQIEASDTEVNEHSIDTEDEEQYEGQ